MCWENGNINLTKYYNHFIQHGNDKNNGFFTQIPIVKINPNGRKLISNEFNNQEKINFTNQVEGMNIT